MKQFLYLLATIALIVGFRSARISNKESYSTLLYSYVGGNITLRTSWYVSPNPDPNCSQSSGCVSVIAAVAGANGHPQQASLDALKNCSNTFINACSIPGTNQKVEVCVCD